MISKISFSDYLANNAISKSDLDLIHRSPAHYIAEKTHPSPPTLAMLFGQALHCFILQPDMFWQTYAVAPGIDRRTKEGKEQWEEWNAINGHKSILASEQVETITAMATSILEHPIASKLLLGDKEVSIFAELLNDVQSKGRLDVLNLKQQFIADIKTTTDARPDAFSRTCWTYRYHVQAAYYIDMVKSETGHDCEFFFIAIENKPPYALAVYHANAEMVERGRTAYLRDLETYKRCLETGVWEAYPIEIQSILLPKWTEYMED